ncbi:MAG: Tyrosine-protein kinase YwqD [Syntrophorhabdaceae bacterium PtaU1.Bin034]|jgi:Mrp family chromosome partitioning ATPase|nr:MAG: Tyrosine-protein kinase YwqD [Syntrophorhabdaceae bacterium PtaU1.Bin034]
MSKLYEALKNADAERKTITEEEIAPRQRLARRSWGWTSQNRKSLERIDDLCQRIDSLLPSPERKVLQFMGSRKGEGTSTVVRQFATISALNMHKSVLILDADRDSPAQHALFDVHPQYCLHDATTDGGPLERAYSQAGIPKLSVCLVSENSVSPAQVLKGSGLWATFRIRFDLVVIDSPPLEGSSDGLALARNADGVVLVIEAEKTRWPVVQTLRDSIIDSGGNILGVVFNKRRYHIPGWIYKWL